MQIFYAGGWLCRYRRLDAMVKSFVLTATTKLRLESGIHEALRGLFPRIMTRTTVELRHCLTLELPPLRQ